MSSKRNHAARSHKTYRANRYAAARSLRGSLPYGIRKMLYDLRFGHAPETPEELADAIEEIVPAEEEESAA